MPKDVSEIPFESAIERLEKLVEEVEEGEIPLSALVEKYEEGVGLLKHCREALGAAELKLEKLDPNRDEVTPLKEEA